MDIEDGLSDSVSYDGINLDTGRQVPQRTKTPNGNVYQHSGLSGSSMPSSENGDHDAQYSVASMPLLRVSRTEEMRRPKPAPISPPPRDPDTALSSSPRNPTLNSFSNYTHNGHSDDLRRITDIYASPVRKRTPVKQSETFSGPHYVQQELADRLPLGNESFTMTTTNNHINDKSNGMMAKNKSVMSNGRERSKISGSTQTSPQEQQSEQPVTTVPSNHYSTNSLSRGMNRHATTAGNGITGQVSLPQAN